MAVLLSLGVLSFPVYSQTTDDFSLAESSPSTESSQKVNESVTFSSEIVILSFCILFIVGWIFHVYMIGRKLDEMDNQSDSAETKYSAFLGSWKDPMRWSFLSTVIVLPVGLSLVLGIFRTNGASFLGSDPFLPELSYQFAIAIFLVMITLEIASIYNTIEHEWRPMLTAALTIDLVAFSAFALMGAPTREQGILLDGLVMLTFFLISGIVSVVSSFLTLYHARTYDLFRRNEKIQKNLTRSK